MKIGDIDRPVQYGGFTCYIEFSTLEEALTMPREIEVEGTPVKLWHKGNYECRTCGMKGHTTKFHDSAMKAKEANEKRRAKRNRRKQQSN